MPQTQPPIVCERTRILAAPPIAETLNAGFYFCHPYSYWERGAGENTNGLIRQYFPKQMKFAIITDMQIDQVEHKLNNRPRKTLGFQTPNEVYFK